MIRAVRPLYSSCHVRRSLGHRPPLPHSSEEVPLIADSPSAAWTDPPRPDPAMINIDAPTTATLPNCNGRPEIDPNRDTTEDNRSTTVGHGCVATRCSLHPGLGRCTYCALLQPLLLSSRILSRDESSLQADLGLERGGARTGRQCGTWTGPQVGLCGKGSTKAEPCGSGGRGGGNVG